MHIVINVIKTEKLQTFQSTFFALFLIELCTRTFISGSQIQIHYEEKSQFEKNIINSVNLITRFNYHSSGYCE